MIRKLLYKMLFNAPLKYSKVRDVKSPGYGTPGSAGIDFYVPHDFVPVTIPPNGDVCIPSGIKVNIQDYSALIAFNKSGVALKKKLVKGAQVIDSDYTGEIHLHLFNTGNSDIEVNPGDKIVQFLYLPIITAKLEQVQEDELYYEATERGDGGFGSTGSK